MDSSRDDEGIADALATLVGAGAQFAYLARVRWEATTWKVYFDELPRL